MKQEDATLFVTVGNTGSYQPQLQQPTKSQGGQTVSNHIADANKMVDTPRTDDAQWGTGRVTTDFARQLERELNEANERIKRLEEAGDALKASGYFGGFGDAVNKWIKVREDKP